MVSDLRKEFKKIKSSQEFKNLSKKTYLASCFMFYENIKDAFWQFDFYDPEKDNMMIFLCKKNLEVKGPEKVLKKKKAEVEELDLNKVNFKFEDAIKKIKQFKDKKYKKEIPNKTIVVLNSIDKKTLWNISFLTQTYNLLNIKLDATNGKIIEHKLDSILKFKA